MKKDVAIFVIIMLCFTIVSVVLFKTWSDPFTTEVTIWLPNNYSIVNLEKGFYEPKSQPRTSRDATYFDFDEFQRLYHAYEDLSTAHYTVTVITSGKVYYAWSSRGENFATYQNHKDWVKTLLRTTEVPFMPNDNQIVIYYSQDWGSILTMGLIVICIGIVFSAGLSVGISRTIDLLKLSKPS